jgi:hypothetical protein
MKLAEIINSVRIMELYPWPREENDKEMITELESRGYVVIPIEELMEAVVEMLKKFPEEK